MDTIKQLFPNFPNDLLKEKYHSFHTQLKFLNHITNDLKSYSSSFPNLPPSLIRSYYIDFLVHLDNEYSNYTHFNSFNKLPFKVLLNIFKYLDIFDLIRFSITNSEIYNYIHSFPFFHNRIKWEHEHHLWISKKLFLNDFTNLVFSSSDPVEQCYKNHVILKRNLIRINPLNSNDKEIVDRYRNLTTYKTFNSFFNKNFGHLCSGKNFFSICSIFFKELTPNQLTKYEHACMVAKRYGFIFCFRALHWWFPDDMAVNTATDLNYIHFDDEIFSKHNMDFLNPTNHSDISTNSSNSSNSSKTNNSSKTKKSKTPLAITKIPKSTSIDISNIDSTTDIQSDLNIDIDISITDDGGTNCEFNR